MKRKINEKPAFRAPNPGVSWGWLIEILVAAASPVVIVMSAGLRKELIKLLRDLYGKAHETPNPWDDFLVGFFLRIMGENPDA